MTDSSSGSQETTVSGNSCSPGSSPQLDSCDSPPTSSPDSGKSDIRDIPKQVSKWNNIVINNSCKGALRTVMEKFLITRGHYDMDIQECVRTAPIDKVLHPHITQMLDLAQQHIGSLYIDFEFAEWKKSDTCELYGHTRTKIRDKINICEESLFKADISRDAKIGMRNFLDNLKDCLATRMRQEIHFVNLFKSLADIVGLYFRVCIQEETRLGPLSNKPFSSIPDLEAFMLSSDWAVAPSQLLAIAEVKKAPPMSIDLQGTPCEVGHHQYETSKAMALRSERTIHDDSYWPEDAAILSQLLGQMLVSWKRSAFYADNQMFAFAIQETKVKLFHLQLNPGDYEPSKEKPAGSEKSYLSSTKSYDILKSEDRGELLNGMAYLASHRMKKGKIV